MASILGKVLGSFGTGIAKGMQNRRKKREEQELWETEKNRKKELLDIQEGYNIKRDKRRRENRFADEEALYQKKLTRDQELRKRQIEEIYKAYPEQAKNPKFQREVKALASGWKIPTEPADPEIRKLFEAGKVQEAIKKGRFSLNKTDQAFAKEMEDYLEWQVKYDKLKNPAKYRAPRQANYQISYGQNQARVFNPLTGKIEYRDLPEGARGRGNLVAGSKEHSATIKMKQNKIKTLENELNMLQGKDEFGEEKKLTGADQKRVDYLKGQLKKEYMNLEQLFSGNQGSGGKNEALNFVDDLFNSFDPRNNNKSKGIGGIPVTLNPNISTQTTSLDLQPKQASNLPAILATPAAPTNQLPSDTAQISSQPQQQIANNETQSEQAKANAFNAIIGTIGSKLGRQLSDDEKGFIADGIFNNEFANKGYEINLENGTFTGPGAPQPRPLEELVTGSFGDFSAEQNSQSLYDKRQSILDSILPSKDGAANFLKKYGLLTDKGASAVRNIGR